LQYYYIFQTVKKDLSQILSILRELHPYIRSEYNVSKIEIFGSYIRNKHNFRSDLDLLVTFSEVPTLLKFIELENFLSDKVGIKVDLVMKNSIKPRLRDTILTGAIPV
jgi:predicted nucleotidyltransferase